MPRRTVPSSARGFSLVELLVALVFTGILMAGMAQVFRTSLTSFTTSGEILSAARRNRASLDLLYDDLNSAGMYLTDLSSPPLDVVSTNPAFQVIPNQAVASVGPDGPATADQLLFYFDQPLPFEGSLGATGGIKTAAELVSLAGAATAADNTYTIDCGNASYANQVKAGMSFVFKDSWESRFIQTVSASGNIITVLAGVSPTSAVSGLGPSGSPAKLKHIPASGVLFFAPSQMVRYSIKVKDLDPQVPGGIPCLVRDQGAYNSGGFVADPAQESVITENVAGFKVYLSADAGQTWVGETVAAGSTTWAQLRTAIDAQLGTSGRQGFTSTVGDENWFRQIPVVVRLDIKTRSAVKRPEYYDPARETPPPIPSLPTDYKYITQSLVIVPRHFGLTMK